MILVVAFKFCNKDGAVLMIRSSSVYQPLEVNNSVRKRYYNDYSSIEYRKEVVCFNCYHKIKATSSGHGIEKDKK
jgi:hypothetical protein